jgi:hypothetical protein
MQLLPLTDSVFRFRMCFHVLSLTCFRSRSRAHAVACLALTATGTGGAVVGSVFDVEPMRIEALAVGETREVKLWAFPREAFLYSNVVVCTIVNNPTPLQFPVSCLGRGMD